MFDSENLGIAVFAGLMGLILGSFANMLIYRVPRKKSIWGPRSQCPNCNAIIAWYDNMPVLSWLILKARCRSCKTPISIKYPIVELIMGLMFFLIVLAHGTSVSTLEYLIFAFSALTASFIDLEFMILPDVFTLSGIVIGLGGSLLNPERSFYSALIGMLVGGGFLWLIAYLYQILRKEDGMGGGDIKLLAWIGAVLGWTSVPFVIFSSSVIGSVVGIIVALRSERGMKAAIPFGPYLTLGALLYMFFGSSLGRMYLELFLPGLNP